MTSDRCALYRQFTAVDGAYRRGDLDALKEALGDPEGFPNCLLPFDLAVGDHPLKYAIAWSPPPFVQTLLESGADPNYPAQDGFPSLIEALATDRSDRYAILGLLLDFGADVQQRGHNDWTPLHFAVVVRRDLAAVLLLLARGADPAARTRIDDCSSRWKTRRRSGSLRPWPSCRTHIRARIGIGRWPSIPDQLTAYLGTTTLSMPRRSTLAMPWG